MQWLAGESLLPRLELDISDKGIPRAVEKIADWMESTGVSPWNDLLGRS